ncbi:MAG: sigma-70 family RNA polymerase sigma factor [Ktedonobacterales bacterium]|nr:sigma-70 family RNA polymerase sigma factor [Ktedonobacterales bacterium]
MRQEPETDDHDAARERALERDLIARSQCGDRSAFNTLVERYQGVAYALALRMLGDAETAADVTQEAFFSAFRHLATFRGTSFRAWLLRIVSNGCFDIFRARGRQPTTSLEALLEANTESGMGTLSDAHLPAALIDASWDPERVALRLEVIEAIQAALLRLPPEQRLALILSDVQGLPYEEIARVMETPLGTVKSRIARARAQLRVVLLGGGELFASPERPIPGNEEK